jgi:hypothetical protein
VGNRALEALSARFRLRYGLGLGPDELPVQDLESRFGSGSMLKS